MKGFICEVWRCILNSCLVECRLSDGCFIADKPKLFHRTTLFSLGAYHLILMVKTNQTLIIPPPPQRMITPPLVSVAKTLCSTKDFGFDCIVIFCMLATGHLLLKVLPVS